MTYIRGYNQGLVNIYVNIKSRNKKIFLILIVLINIWKNKHTYTFIHVENSKHSPKNSEVFEAKERYLIK